MSSQQDDTDENPPTITYTRKRTTTKTRTAASSARRRNNLPLCHASSGGGGGDDDGKDQHSWFARKSAMWTDQQIVSHLVSGGAASSNSGDGVSFVGDVIMGAKDETGKKRKRRSGPRFAWEEDEKEDEGGGVIRDSTHRMTAAPTLMDIMDEKDKIDLMSPLEVGKAFDTGNARTNAGASKKRPQNEALAQLAIITGNEISIAAPTDGNTSIGWNLLRVWGYRSRLGVALVPLQGFDKSDKCIDELDESATHEAKWLASKRLRAIYLPSIQHKNPDDDASKNESKSVDVGVHTKNKSTVLVIPPPKTNRHGIGYDPFRNAPEFKAFHEYRLRMAKKHGKEGGGDSTGDRKRTRYFTDDLGKDVHPLWENATKETESVEFDVDTENNQQDNSGKDRPSHYAADRNYEHLIGSKASSGFALEDEDDENVYDGYAHSFPSRHTMNHDGEDSKYSLEVQSPVASDEEHNGADSNAFGDLFTQNKASVKKSKLSTTEPAGENLADAWSAWGLGLGGSSASGNHGPTQLPLTQDGKPPLAGFVLSRKLQISSDHVDERNVPKRWAGPSLPSGYVLKRHDFSKEEGLRPTSDDRLDRTDCGLGLDFQSQPRQRKQPARSMPPKVLPTSETYTSAPGRKLVAKDGTALNFHAVRESMKNRFVTGATSTSHDSAQEAAHVAVVDNEEKEEWIDVTITTWMPSRLLCKRWGVPIPTNYDESTDVSDMKRHGEEEFFRTTIYNPAVANQDGPTRSNEMSNNLTKQPTITKIVEFNSLIEVDDSAAPSRPSEAIFQSIFDVQSDMDISDDDEADEDETYTSTVINSRNESKTRGSEHDALKFTDDVMVSAPDAQFQTNESSPLERHRDYSSPSSYESSSTVSHLKRKHKHRHRNDRHRRHSWSSNESDDSTRRKRKHSHRSRSSYKEKKKKKDKRR
eukprot:CCRYP_008826-RA/>CCRYP_008826-RA protein AED:0.00 eAED:0.00 QI:223/-1/1/1/-1/1/1/278/924